MGHEECSSALDFAARAEAEVVRKEHKWRFATVSLNCEQSVALRHLQQWYRDSRHYQMVERYWAGVGRGSVSNFSVNECYCAGPDLNWAS
jgi:hypothetical protein